MSQQLYKRMCKRCLMSIWALGRSFAWITDHYCGPYHFMHGRTIPDDIQ